MFFGPQRGVAAEEDAGARDTAWSSRPPPACPIYRIRFRCRARSTGNAFSWPMARITSSAGKKKMSIVFEFFGLSVPLQALEIHAGQLPVLDHETLRRVIDQDLDAFFFGILQLPGRSFEESARPPRHHFDIFATEPADDRQQSMAVLPTPMISTFSPTESMWPKAMDSSQSMPIWMRSVSCRPGCRALCRAARPCLQKPRRSLRPAVLSCC